MTKNNLTSLSLKVFMSKSQICSLFVVSKKTLLQCGACLLKSTSIKNEIDIAPEIGLSNQKKISAAFFEELQHIS